MVEFTQNTQIASFDVDAQYCFTPVCPEELPVAQGDEIADELNAQAKFAQYRIGSKDAHSPQAVWVADMHNPQFSPVEGANVDIRWNKHAVPGTKGFELIEGLPHPAEYDFFVWKGIEPDMHPYGACYHDLADTRSTGVIEWMRAKHITHVIVGGLATDYCVKTTVLQLLAAGFSVIVNLAACRGIAQDTVTSAMQEMREAGAILISNHREIQRIQEP
ncbi:MAG: isochorismatase family protein [Alphaproteobacteria bacterium]|nr:isochorismatase family protein [Alphaproteobacteria bacterium]